MSKVFAVGIDLGTTHTVVAYAPLGSSEPPRIFEIPQLVGPAEIEARPLLASMLYAPLEGEVVADEWGDAPWVVGEYARMRGSEVPGRFVASAKSWLSHAAVDRSAPILPWGAKDEPADLPRISPIDASARYLLHVKRAWDAAFPKAPLAEQELVLTVPASFDEAARELTLQAAKIAGLEVRLLEEPQATFYDYMQKEGEGAIRTLLDRAGGEALVLVVDVGGGTTDLSLIRVAEGTEGRPYDLSRVAVGPHLLLGGDNMDLALAHACESKLSPDERLDARLFAQLTLSCRSAKEKLLGDDAPSELPITLARRGAKLVGGTLSTTLTQDEAERIVLEGFWPVVPRDARPQRARTALVAFGLPYERDVAITRHVASFCARHASTGPSALLLNGGVFRAARIAKRLEDVVAGWGGPTPSVLPHADPDLSVARGAVAYALALRGRGLRIESGAARGFYIGLGAPAEDQARRAVCVLPRGTKEGEVRRVEDRVFALTVGRPVRFDLFASDTATGHVPGQIVEIDEETFAPLPPLATTVAASDGEVNVVLEGELTPVGTLELSCVEIDAPSPRRFRLAFQIRGEPSPTEAPRLPVPRTSTIAGRRLEQAFQALDEVFGKGKKGVSPRAVKDLLRELERILGERPSWPLPLLRSLFDRLAPNASARRRSADHERIFWLLAGYCLRPGFGDPLDATRIAKIERLFFERVQYGEPRVWQAFFIAWRRMAGGLDEETQTAMRQVLDPFLAPPERKLKKPKGWAPDGRDELLELASSLERVPPLRRVELGGWILERTWTERDPRLWAAIGRLGARVPAYASVHHVIAPSHAERWLDHLLREKWEEVPTAAQAAVQLARVTNDRARDVSEKTRLEVAKKLAAIDAREEWQRAVREYVPERAADREAFFGESLPIGLRLAES